MAELDESQEAVRNVDQITESEPVNGEDLVESEDLRQQFREAKERLESEDLKRQLREAKERLKAESGEPI